MCFRLSRQRLLESLKKQTKKTTLKSSVRSVCSLCSCIFNDINFKYWSDKAWECENNKIQRYYITFKGHNQVCIGHNAHRTLEITADYITKHTIVCLIFEEVIGFHSFTFSCGSGRTCFI